MHWGKLPDDDSDAKGSFESSESETLEPFIQLLRATTVAGATPVSDAEAEDTDPPACETAVSEVAETREEDAESNGSPDLISSRAASDMNYEDWLARRAAEAAGDDEVADEMDVQRFSEDLQQIQADARGHHRPPRADIQEIPAQGGQCSGSVLALSKM